MTTGRVAILPAELSFPSIFFRYCFLGVVCEATLLAVAKRDGNSHRLQTASQCAHGPNPPLSPILFSPKKNLDGDGRRKRHGEFQRRYSERGASEMREGGMELGKEKKRNRQQQSLQLSKLKSPTNTKKEAGLDGPYSARACPCPLDVHAQF